MSPSADVNANDAKVIVDAVLEQYIKYISEAADATEHMLYRQLTDQYNSLKNEIQGRESVCAALRRSLGTEIPQELISNKRVRLDEAQARLRRTAESDHGAGMGNETAGCASDSNSLVDPSPRPLRYHEDAEWRTLHLEVRRAQHQIDKSVLTPNSPDRGGLMKDLEFAQELRREREQQLDEQWSDRLTNGTGLVTAVGGAISSGPARGAIPVDRQLARAKVEEQLLRADLEKQDADFNDLFDRAQSLARGKRRATAETRII